MATINLNGCIPFITENEYLGAEDSGLYALKLLKEKTGRGSEFTGFVTLPSDYDKDELVRVKSVAEKIKSESQALVVIGIGGSFLGARAVIDILGNNDMIEINYVGCSTDPDYLTEIYSRVKNMDFSVIMVSKSGTTTEPAIAFRIFRQLLENKYGEEADSRIYCITDKSRGKLHDEAVQKGWEMFTVPDDIGGRYSVLSSVGLLPAAVMGVDVDALLAGARDGMDNFLKEKVCENPALLYAITRYILEMKGKTFEILACYDHSFETMEKWWQQLVAESEGKDGKGIFPAGLIYSTDLHSIGQMIQDGKRDFFETVVKFDKTKTDFKVPSLKNFDDGLDYIEGVNLSEITEKERLGTAIAHVDGGVPNILIECKEKSEYEIGNLIYFFEIAEAISCYMLDVNPFNQPGVEGYKQNMFALLGKIGYDDIREKLLSKNTL